MRIQPGGPQTVSMESISGRMLMDYGVNEPDFIPTMLRMYQDNETPLISLLDMKGMKTQGVNYSTNDRNYRTVGSNHIQYAIASTDLRKQYFRTNTQGITFKDDANAITEPGKSQRAFYIWLDNNGAGFQEIIELADNRTQLYVLKDPEEDNGSWLYKVKIVTNDPDDYVDPRLLEEGSECMPQMNLNEQDFSERGVEKYTFGGWGHTYLSLQRFKYSYSGTAKSMKVSGKWVLHNGQKTFITEAEELMMKRAGQYLEYQFVWGKQTVTTDTNKVILKNELGREVLGGSGLIESNDGPVEIPYNNGWTKGFINAFIKNIDAFVYPGQDGKREVVVLMAPEASLSFSQTMSDWRLPLTMNITGEGAEKGVIDTYAFYELDGIRIIPKRYSALRSHRRPGKVLSDGTRNNEWDCIALPLGIGESGNQNYELVQLRPMAKGTVAGIDQGGNIASSVDGTQTHVLFQNGIIARGQTFMIYRPFYS